MDKFPKSEGELVRCLRTIERMRKRREFEEALIECSILLQFESTRVAGLRARAGVFADMREKELEIADREALVAIVQHEPADFFDLGVALWQFGELNRAAEVFARGLEIGERESFHYYENATRMHLVALLIKLGCINEARRECDLIPNGYESYLPSEGVVSKEHLAKKISELSRLKCQ